MIASVGTGRFTFGGNDTIFRPRIPLVRNPVVWAHGLGDSGNLINAESASRNILRRVCDQGFSVVAPSTTNGWGNQTTQDRVDDALTYHTDNLGGTGKAILFAVSMGTCAVMNWAVNTPTRVACIVAFLPCVDLQAVREDPSVGPSFRPSMDTAYNITYPTPVPDASNPSNNTAALSGFPIQLWAATADPVSTNVATFVANTGAEYTDLGNYGHTFTAISHADIDRIAAFVQEHTA